MKLTDEQIAEIAGRSTDKISKILRTKERKTAKQKYDFDISNHEFYDYTLSLHNHNKNGVCFHVEDDYPEFNKKDIIALAKHFKLTAEDLK